MHTLKDHHRKRKRSRHASEDLRLLRLLHARRYRLENDIERDWNRALSTELDCIIALEDAVLTGWAARVGMR